MGGEGTTFWWHEEFFSHTYNLHTWKITYHKVNGMILRTEMPSLYHYVEYLFKGTQQLTVPRSPFPVPAALEGVTSDREGLLATLTAFVDHS